MSQEQSPSIAPRGRQVFDAAIGTVIIATFFVSLRFFTRLRILRLMGWEDYFIGIALLLSIGNTVGMCYQADAALGQHILDLPAEAVTNFLKAVFATIIVYNLSLTFIKLSFIFQYLRIFNTPKMRQACYIQLGIVIVYGLWLFLYSFVGCTPLVSNWDLSVKGHCLPREPIWFTNASLNIITDFMIIILPMPAISSLNLPRRQKIVLSGIFALGLFVCIISIIRLQSLLIAAKSTDPTYDNVSIAIWSCIELNLGIVCSSLPTIKPLVARVFPHLLSTAFYTRSMYHQYGTGRDTRHDMATARGNRKSALDQGLRTKRAIGETDSNQCIVGNGEEYYMERLKDEEAGYGRKNSESGIEIKIQAADTDSLGSEPRRESSILDRRPSGDKRNGKRSPNRQIRVETTVEQTVDMVND